MRRRWYYFKWILRTNRLLFAILLCLGIFAFFLFENRGKVKGILTDFYEEYGVMAVDAMIKTWFPGSETEDKSGLIVKTPELFAYLGELPEKFRYGEDPAYEKMLANAWQQRILEENAAGAQEENGGGKQESQSASSQEAGVKIVQENISLKPSGSYVIREKLADYDYLMKSFYSVHPTTTAGRELVSAESFLSKDLSIEQCPGQPQILIYHTHSQETFADYPQNSEATIVGVGAYLAKLLEAQGYQVIHDTTVYDVKDGKLDRSQAYTYALDGISGILQNNPSIEVVLDIHRDGVDEDTHLVTMVNGKPTAQIMFFNGTSQTPDGPIEYLPNPNREANMAFSFQMKLLASEQYPGFTRKIYLKGLRYNQHVRARTALVEVGAQTNTYAEALNAMEPLADILCQVLSGN